MVTQTNPRHTTIAAARVSRASLLLGALGLTASLLVIARLLETWRVTAGAASHHISVFGQRLSYPAANFDAVVILALAAAGLLVLATAAFASWRELLAARRFARRLAIHRPRAVGDALVIDDERPQAFCAGLLSPRVYVTTAALALLDDAALAAVLAHEREHARRRDPLRLAAGRIVARSLFFVPGLGALVQRAASLAELSADERAVGAAPGNRSGLASAMLSFDDAAAAGHATGIDPARVDQLLGEGGNWRFPVVLCLTAAAAIALVAAVALLAGRVATGSATLAAPFLSRQPCVVVLAAIPAALGLLAFAYRNAAR